MSCNDYHAHTAPSGNFTVGGQNAVPTPDCCNCKNYCPCCGRRLSGYRYEEPWPWYPQVPWYVPPTYPHWYTGDHIVSGTWTSEVGDVTYTYNTNVTPTDG